MENITASQGVYKILLCKLGLTTDECIVLRYCQTLAETEDTMTEMQQGKDRLAGRMEERLSTQKDSKREEMQ